MTHKPQIGLVNEIKDIEQQIPIGSEWAHYKNPAHTYKVTGLVVIEADDSIGVVYRAQYGYRLSFLRPALNWLEEVEWQDKKIPRFDRLD